MSKELKPCPFCGAEVELEKLPLWHEGHGYHGCYEFKIRCKKCGTQPTYSQNDTVYRSENKAIENVIKVWNRRAAGRNKIKANCEVEVIPIWFVKKWVKENCDEESAVSFALSFFIKTMLKDWETEETE